MPQLKHRRLREEVIRACLEMNELGINQGTSGNVSARNEEGFLMTPSGIPYEDLRPEQIVQMDLDGGYLGEVLPSTEWRMHFDIYRERPEAQAVVHTHAAFCTVLACLRIGIPAFHYMIGVGGGTDIRCSDYATFGTQELSAHMLEALRDRSACLLANHGMICFGPSLKKALWLANEVEALARQYWHARQAGEPVLLSDAEMRGVLARFKTYGKQSHELAEGDAAAVIPPVRRDAPAAERKPASSKKPAPAKRAATAKKKAAPAKKAKSAKKPVTTSKKAAAARPSTSGRKGGRGTAAA